MNISSQLEDRDITSNVMKFVACYVRIKTENLSLETDLMTDLGIDGDDAIEFIDSFGKEFNIDFSGFDSNKYFGSEAGFNPLVFLFKRKKIFPLKIKLLVQAARRKEWLENVSNV
jgi:hypothetical protein